jgi:putative transposase
MRKSRFTTEQIIGFLKQAEAGMAVSELGRQHGFSPASFYAWRAKYGGMEAEDAKRLKELESENAPQVGRLHAAVPGLPLVVRRRADAGLAAQVLDRHAGIALLEDRDDLRLAELRLLHGTSWQGKHARKLYF